MDQLSTQELKDLLYYMQIARTTIKLWEKIDNRMVHTIQVISAELERRNR